MPEQYEYKIDVSLVNNHSIVEVQQYLNDRGVEGWQVVFTAPTGLIWWMRRKQS